MMISYVIPLYCEDQFVGVVGMDFDYTVLIKKVHNIKIYENGFAHLELDGVDIHNGTDTVIVIDVLSGIGIVALQKEMTVLEIVLDDPMYDHPAVEVVRDDISDLHIIELIDVKMLDGYQTVHWNDGNLEIRLLSVHGIGDDDAEICATGVQGLPVDLIESYGHQDNQHYHRQYDRQAGPFLIPIIFPLTEHRRHLNILLFYSLPRFF